MSSFDPNKLKLPSNTNGEDKTCTPERKVKRKCKYKQFVKGPIQLAWLGAASKLPGKTCQVGLAIWYLAGFSGGLTVRLTSITLSLFGVDRHAKYRGLKALENASLVAVNRKHGKNPVVTIIEVQE